MTESQAEYKFGKLTVSEFRGLILKRDEESELAAFYLLRHKLIAKIVTIYSTAKVKDDLDDVLSDFYLYLRDGRNGKNTGTFQTLEGLRSQISFESYVLSIFKKFLIDRLNAEQRDVDAQTLADNMPSGNYNSMKDQRIVSLGVMISYIDEFSPDREKFIFFRSLLAKLDKEQVISNDEMAEAMGLTYGNYRQIDSRMRQEALNRLAEVQKGTSFELDDQHKSLAVKVEQDFEKLNVIIQNLYEETLSVLNCRDEIRALRDKDKIDDTIRFSISDDDDIRFRISDSGIPVCNGADRNLWDIENSEPQRMLRDVVPYDPKIVIDFSDIYPKGEYWKKVVAFLHEELPEEYFV